MEPPAVIPIQLGNDQQRQARFMLLRTVYHHILRESVPSAPPTIMLASVPVLSLSLGLIAVMK